MQKICDANVILRYLMHDDDTFYENAKKEILKNPIVPILIISEVVYVLKKVYLVPRDDIADSLVKLSDEVEYENLEIVLETLKLFKEENLDFADCYLLARNKLLNENIATFDNKLNNYLKKMREKKFLYKSPLLGDFYL